MLILGIETSCDETGVALYDKKNGLLANKLYSQIKLHAKYGGVVPELASRGHARKIIPLIQATIKEANINFKEIDAIAYTAGPGLIGSLLVGASVACGLAFVLNIPVIPINHMEGHLLSSMLEKKVLKFPLIALLISGGHTQLIGVNKIGQYKILGESIDDAVGEAFDKTAKLLGLGYPGGSKLSKLAMSGIKGRFIFPRPMINKPGLDFSFSGLKTFAAKIISTNDNSKQTKADIARAFEDAVIDTLIIKCKRALIETGFKYLLIAGGVSANIKLRKKMEEKIGNICNECIYTSPEFCTDNGAMIAYTGMIRIKSYISNSNIFVNPRWSLIDLSLIS